ncbi:class I SAM-dependent methyltransferase [Desulfotignum phosphitoxidans]|uniref:SAM binding motif, methyltransferase 12 family protein n=1 Tax=Desulfotignum phosphitoxidans DSM 13687 TaxID=1286635 RepID=S0G1Q8_9BACT|nr:class I SAM-dependent methyltransferase [Desulfotignum phosphitoxidans]EMS77641.1 SAM binding motif, methyltransferase 12 family protein [Desulfotignum phosphitoxidans DSM 13687]
MEKNESIIRDVAKYYSSKLAEHGETPQGVDWNGEYGQLLRFVQLCKIVDESKEFSLNDLGCGYGALFDHLNQNYPNFMYYGYDISETMILSAQKKFEKEMNAEFFIDAEPSKLADYSIASGIFNVRFGYSDDEWWDYIVKAIDSLNKSCRFGFAFNCLTSYSDKDKMREDLYYADPCKIFDICKKRYSRHVALLHDYELYEFSILVRKGR